MPIRIERARGEETRVARGEQRDRSEVLSDQRDRSHCAGPQQPALDPVGFVIERLCVHAQQRPAQKRSEREKLNQKDQALMLLDNREQHLRTSGVMRDKLKP